MKKIKVLFLVLLMLGVGVGTTFAVHSNISENRLYFQNDNYDCYFQTKSAEGHIHNYLTSYTYHVFVEKHIKSETYANKIREFIINKYQAPLSNRETVKRTLYENDLIILQELEVDLNNKTIFFVDGGIWGKQAKRFIYKGYDLNTILGYPFFFNDINEHSEYRQLANKTVEFLESIKDIYLDTATRKEYEKKEADYQIVSKGNTYLSSWSGNLTLLAANGKSKIYMDIPSFHEIGPKQYIYEGWLQFVPDESLKLDVRESKIYFRVNYHDSKLYAIFEIKTDNDGKKIYHNVNPAEMWTMDDGKYVNTVLELLGEKFKLGKTFRQLMGFDIGNNPNKKPTK